MKFDLRITEQHYKTLYEHLFPGDNKESVALALCGRLETTESVKFLVHKLILIPVSDCTERTEVIVNWKTDKLIAELESASKRKFSILKIHSHPTGFPDFSKTDDKSDHELFTSLHSWIDNVSNHASAVMLPDGSIFARAWGISLKPIPVKRVMITGGDIRFFNHSVPIEEIEEFSIRTAQTFGKGTTQLLKTLSIAVIGCSGTGSPTIEQLFRLGVGKLVIVDPDVIEKKNLNRILTSTLDDAVKKSFKVDVIKKAIEKAGLGTEVHAYSANLFDSPDVIREVASCDAIFGCMDSVDGRHLLNQVASIYLTPYFDLGVKLVADGQGGVSQIWGTVHYVTPGQSSLLTRGVYTNEDLRAAGILRKNPEQFQNLKKEGYIKNVNVESPAVISVNMQISSLSVIELLARLHRFRVDENNDSAVTRISLTDGYIQKDAESSLLKDSYLEKLYGRGDMIPFLNMPEFN